MLHSSGQWEKANSGKPRPAYPGAVRGDSIADGSVVVDEGSLEERLKVELLGAHNDSVPVLDLFLRGVIICREIVGGVCEMSQRAG